MVDLAIKIPEQRQEHGYVVFIINFKHISNLFLVLLFVDFEKVNVCWRWVKYPFKVKN